MQFCIVCQSLINSVRLLCNVHFDSLNDVDNVVVVNETDRLCCICACEIIVFKVIAYGASYEYTTAGTTNENM